MGWFSSAKKEKVMELPAQAPQIVAPLEELPSPPKELLAKDVPAVTQELGPGDVDKGREPFFVRIDKFNEARDSFNEISSQLKSMEKILMKFQETQEKEKEEIESWKKDITDIKGYLSDMDNDIFNKI